MRRASALLILLLSPLPLWGQAQPPTASRCQVFIDREFIWTLEMVGDSSTGFIPVMNIITFADGQWDLRPPQVHLTDPGGREAEIEKFSIDTGVPGEPQIVRYLKVHGGSFIGLDLEGDYSGFSELASASIELGDSTFQLEPIDCLEYEGLVQKINQINFDSPDVRQDFRILDIPLKGQRKARRLFY